MWRLKSRNTRRSAREPSLGGSETTPKELPSPRDRARDCACASPTPHPFFWNRTQEFLVHRRKSKTEQRYRWESLNARIKWRAQGDDLRTFLSEFTSSLPQIQSLVP